MRILVLAIFVSLRLAAQDQEAPAMTIQQDPMEAFEKGIQAYKEDNFTESINMFRGILDQGLESAEVHFNLGNAYFKSNDIPRAILHFEKALKLKPEDDDTRTNLEMANLKTIDKVESKPEMAITTMWIALLNSYTIDGWGKLVLIFSFLAFAVMLIYLFTRGYIKKISFFSGSALVVISVISYSLGMQLRSLQMKNNHAIILSPTVTVKSSPEVDGTQLFVIHEGTKIRLLGQVGEWTEISLMNGNKGWVKSEVYEGI